MAARALIASRNACTTLTTYFDLEKYSKASPEMKAAIQALESVRAGGCKCGNARPMQRFLGCGKHLACEECHLDFAKVANRKGGCNFPGCNCQVLWPCRPIEAFDQVQEAASDAFRLLDHALQIEEQKDIGEGARRRAVALAERDDAAMSEGDAPAETLAAELAPPPEAPRRNKRKADFTADQWEDRKDAIKERRIRRHEDAQKLAEHPKLVSEVERLQAILAANRLAF